MPGRTSSASKSSASRPATSGRSPAHSRRKCFITTDLDDNQITAFHPGAMGNATINHVADATGIGLGIVAPDNREGMIQHAREFADAKIPFIFDPGQALPLFTGPEMMEFIEIADYVTVNEYEARCWPSAPTGPSRNSRSRSRR